MDSSLFLLKASVEDVEDKEFIFKKNVLFSIGVPDCTNESPAKCKSKFPCTKHADMA